MLNDPPSQPTRPPNKDAAAKSDAPRQQVMLHIPAVRPFVTYTLIGVYVLLFVAALSSPTILPANNVELADVVMYGQYLRLATGMFLHSNLVHLLVVLFILYTFGTWQERIFGHVRFIAIYLLGGLGGMVLAVLLLALTGDLVGTVIGASSAVGAMLGAELSYLYQHRRLLGARGRDRRNRVLLFSVINLLVGVMYSSGVLAGLPTTLAAWSPIGGVVAGLVLGWYLAPFFNLTKHPNHPGAIRAEDINPLNRRTTVVLIYISVLLVLLIISTWLVRS
jgi:rhomboid protease GluP